MLLIRAAAADPSGGIDGFGKKGYQAVGIADAGKQFIASWWQRSILHNVTYFGRTRPSQLGIKVIKTGDIDDAPD
jgi:hypothetical protein